MDLSRFHSMLHYVTEGKIREFEDLFNQSPQLRSIGASIDISDLKHPVVMIQKVGEIHRGGILGEAVNGGVISMLVDLAIGLLGFSYFTEGLTATHHLSIHFIKPLIASAVRLEATETHVINNRVFGHVKVMNEKGEVCAYASGVLVKGIRK
jgi:uncharacterized protein (TIGR00369 family)